MHHLVLAAWRDHAGGNRAFLVAHEHRHFRAKRLLVELDRLFAAAIEEQIGLYLHHGSPFLGWKDKCRRYFFR